MRTRCSREAHRRQAGSLCKSESTPLKYGPVIGSPSQASRRLRFPSPPAVGQPALARHGVLAFPGHLRWGSRRWRAMGFLLSLATCGGAAGAGAPWGSCFPWPPAVGQPALARHGVLAFPGHLRWGSRRWRAMGFLLSLVPKGEGPGAPWQVEKTPLRSGARDEAEAHVVSNPVAILVAEGGR
jgi:hypothetical protein